MSQNSKKDHFFYWRGAWFSKLPQLWGRLFRTQSDFWKSCSQKAQASWNNRYYLAGFHFLIGLGHGITLLCLFPLFFVLTSGILLMGFLAFFLLSTIIAVTYQTVIKCRRLSILCPKCANRYSVPAYKCPQCGAYHKAVIPSSRWGILYHKCQCGEKLPTFAFLKGKKTKHLTSFCPLCRNERADDMNLEYIPITIPLIGGRKSGKTSVKNALIDLAISSLPSHRCFCQEAKGDMNEIQKIQNNLRSGTMPGGSAPKILRMDVFRKAPARRIYWYDPDGMNFQNVSTFGENFAQNPAGDFYLNMNYLVLVLDPFSIQRIRYETNATAVGTEDDLFTILERFYIYMLNQKSTHILKRTPCAVVITKMDFPELRQVTDLHSGCDESECRRFMETYCMELYNQLNQTFSKLAFFAVSCTGGKSRKFEPEGFEPVLNWLISEQIIQKRS